MTRRCACCGRPLSRKARPHARLCSAKCRMAMTRRRRGIRPRAEVTEYKSRSGGAYQHDLDAIRQQTKALAYLIERQLALR
jgi:hypothetical protein